MHAALSVLSIFCASAAASRAPIVGDASFSLDGSAWSATAADGTRLAAVVPGDLVSDLSRAGVISDPYFELEWRDKAGLWDLQNWTYELGFTTPTGWVAPGSTTLLVFESVKMAADISLNGSPLGAATSQHLRYAFDVGALLAPPGGANTLTVAFPAGRFDVRNDAGRMQGCSGGWGE